MPLTNDINLTATKRVNKPTLKKGSRGIAVKDLQKLLYDFGAFALTCNYGLPEVFIDGVFGDDTEAAVKAFQRQRFLKIDGVVGDVTWQVLYRVSSGNLPILRKGSKGELVSRVQQRLIISGDYKGNIDGDFGISTETAVKTFQKRTKLSADGEIGDRTWTELTKIQESVC
ncbi:peptidoglycan-binding domain-containing protein [Calothrix sp. PCC 6303]|uniref:peptidoglycan-binding domain-containing protein n=1 Tax=Calothrix sp. PCC 6303 TaxID=1170562 RepID=UPI0002A03052|nr:peptidoglycan-binding protein [Calothrix sp. PCC 6303]AFZ03373.1 Peptidoglycan-binding domain 1 protein [Calothrix sp. PCC 6303]